MLVQGYPVTKTMTLEQLIDILVTDEYVYYVDDSYLYIRDTSAIVTNNILSLFHGVSVLDTVLYLESE